MYQNYPYMRSENYQPNPINNFNSPYQTNQVYPNTQNDERFLGLFAVPFLLGGVAGAALAPRRPYPYPVPAPYPVYPAPYPRPYPVTTTNYYYK